MKRAALLIVVMVSIVGCMSSTIAIPPETAEKYKRFQVVAMESPPLMVPVQVKAGDLLPRSQTETTLVGVHVINTVMLFFPGNDYSQLGGENPEELQLNLDGKRAWTPTMVIAKEVREQLISEGMSAEISWYEKPIPGIKIRNNPFFMENWLYNTRKWYNDKKQVPEYGIKQLDTSFLIIEVGLAHYEIANDRLFLQVLAKVFKPSDGHIAGRARAVNFEFTPNITPLQKSFANDAKLFKAIFASQIRILVRECLSDLGLS